MTRLVLSVADLAPLVSMDEGRRNIRNPYHDAEIDRDVVTNAHAALVWVGNQFSTCPDPESKPPSVAPMLEPCPVLGTTTLFSILAWVDEKDDCPGCGGRLVRHCSTCGEVPAPDRPGSFCGVLIDRALLAMYLRPLPRLDQAVEVRHAGKVCPLLLVAEAWTVIIMPMNDRMVQPAGEPFAIEQSLPLAPQPVGLCIVTDAPAARPAACPCGTDCEVVDYPTGVRSCGFVTGATP